MSPIHAVDLYELLPALYRRRDAEQGYPLRALLETVADQVDILKGDIDRLWDNFFIETCDDWVIPYIGELVGNNPLHGLEHGMRADVAKTVYYRRRKATLPMLEELARDVTGWGAHVIEGFEQLAWTQNLNHQRMQWAEAPWDKLFETRCAKARFNPVAESKRDPSVLDRVGSVNLRSGDILDRIDGPFDTVSRFPDLRPAGNEGLRYRLGSILFCLWRLKGYPLSGIEARRYSYLKKEKGRFFFSPLGNPTPLFHQAQREAGEHELAWETQVPAPIRPLAFHFRLGDYYGQALDIAIYRGGRIEKDQLIPAEQIVSRDLSRWSVPPTGKVAVDVALGRIAFAPGEAPPQVTVSFRYGFGGALGGGPYRRDGTLAESAGGNTRAVSVSRQVEDADFSSLSGALGSTGVGQQTVITLLDSATYREKMAIDLAPGQRLVIQAADGQRPTLRPSGRLVVHGGGEGATLTLNGLLIEGHLFIESELAGLNLVHCTLVPGSSLDESGEPKHRETPSLQVAGDKKGPQEVNIDHAIVGPLFLPPDCRLACRDSILQRVGALPAIAEKKPGVNGCVSGPITTLERVTVLGAAYLRALPRATDVLFMGAVQVERTQMGSLRFCYLNDPPGSHTPRRYRCQPDLAWGREPLYGELLEKVAVLDILRPRFSSTRYGDPGYAQLSRRTAGELLQGAENGAEMGVFNHLRQAQREANLRLRLEEYLPFGLEADLVYIT